MRIGVGVSVWRVREYTIIQNTFVTIMTSTTRKNTLTMTTNNNYNYDVVRSASKTTMAIETMATTSMTTSSMSSCFSSTKLIHYIHNYIQFGFLCSLKLFFLLIRLFFVDFLWYLKILFMRVLSECGCVVV